MNTISKEKRKERLIAAFNSQIRRAAIFRLFKKFKSRGENPRERALVEVKAIMRFGYNERRKNLKDKAEDVIIAMLRQSNFFLLICKKLENYTINGIYKYILIKKL